MSDEIHSYNQARAQAEGIAAMVAALELDWDRLEELRRERDALSTEAELADWEIDNGDEFSELKDAAGEYESREDAEEAIQNDPLSVQVRSGWTDVGGAFEAEEFEILLCTGGPAVRIRGELGQYNEPTRAWIEHLDWGTSWQQYFGNGVSQESLLTYSRFFLGG